MKRFSRYFPWGFFIALVALSACKNEEPLPVYLDLGQSRVKPFTQSGFTTNLGVKNIWIYQGADLEGVYPTEKVVPVIPNGAGKLLLVGGIFQNGLSSARNPYPFWQPIVVDIDVDLLDTLKPKPVFEYYPDTALSYPFIESFEAANFRLTSTETGSNAARIALATGQGHTGTGAGRVVFTETQYLFEVTSSGFLFLPQTGNNDIYAEITYRGTNVVFSTGLFYVTGANAGDLETGTFFPTSENWNTIYVHLNDLVRSVPQGSQFKLYIRVDNFSNATNKGIPGTLFLDNIRIVHFR